MGSHHDTRRKERTLTDNVLIHKEIQCGLFRIGFFYWHNLGT